MYSDDIVGSIINLINSTGSVAGGSYTSGSFIDPYMQDTLKNRPGDMAKKKVISFGGNHPQIEIVPGPIKNQDLTPRWRTTAPGGYAQKKMMEVRIYCYAPNLGKWDDPGGTERKNDDNGVYTRTYLEYLAKGIKKYSPTNFTTFRIPAVGEISDVERFPEDSSQWYGFLPIMVSWYDTGSALF